MVAETYACSTSKGTIEFGWTFKLSHETDDQEFDLVLGEVDGDKQEAIEPRWNETRAMVEAMAVAATAFEE